MKQNSPKDNQPEQQQQVPIDPGNRQIIKEKSPQKQQEDDESQQKKRLFYQ